ncbi:MAG: hypothetical protein R3E58_05215 [Phycisphaerae bacterium]
MAGRTKSNASCRFSVVVKRTTGAACEAGVSKTAIVEGLATKIVENDIPEILADRRIVVLDLAMMVAG